MMRESISTTYTYSFFSIAGLMVIIIPLLMLAPILNLIYDHGWEAFCERALPLFSSLYELIMEDGFVFLYNYWVLILLFLGMIYIFIERLLVVSFTKLTITDHSIIYKNPYNHIEIPINEIEGFEYHAKQRYVLYSKDKKKKLYVDMMLNKS